MLSSPNRRSRITNDYCVIWNWFNYDGACSDRNPRTNVDSLANHSTYTDPAAMADSYISSQVSARTNMHCFLQYTVVINSSARIDNPCFSNRGIDIDDRTRHNNATRAYPSMQTDRSARVNNHSHLSSCRLQHALFFSSRFAISDRDNYAIEFT